MELSKIVKLVKPFTDKKHPTLKYAFYNSKNREMVATNSKQLLVIKDVYLGDENYFVDVNKKCVDNTSCHNVVRDGYILFQEPEIQFSHYEKIIPQRMGFGRLEGASFSTIIMNTGVIFKELVAYCEINIIPKFNKNLSAFDNVYPDSFHCLYNSLGNVFGYEIEYNGHTMIYVGMGLDIEIKRV